MIDNTKYDFIFLIASSNDLECYAKMRPYTRKYFDLYKDKIKYFFTEAIEDLDCELLVKDDYIYTKGPENVKQGGYDKFNKSMNYINENYNYDVIISTTIPAFWNLNNLLNLKNSIPLNNFAGGFIVFGQFLSGTGVMLSKDVSVNVCSTVSKILYPINEISDVFFSKLLCNMGYSLTDVQTISSYRWGFFINDNLSIPMNEIDTTLYYRIKNNDRNIDVQLHDILCRLIYNV
jgi:hypothetical protein